MRKIEIVIIHCTGSDYAGDDSYKAIEELHISPKSKRFKWGEYETTGKGFGAIGYHFIILDDGSIHIGRQVSDIGAHCSGYNKNSIGIALSGNKFFSEKQKEALGKLLRNLKYAHGLENHDIIGHNKLNSYKTCPNFDLDEFLEEL